jgi:5-methylcytosine-specific restriction endonuclease McrA
MSPDQPVSRRGTTNGNARGSVKDRERRRAWLVDTYRADRDVVVIGMRDGRELVLDTTPGRGEPACRCYRCGRLLTVATVTVDRIIPGCQGGTYRRENIRPACGPCNSSTGAAKRRRKR